MEHEYWNTVRNKVRSYREVKAWEANKPSQYFAYVRLLFPSNDKLLDAGCRGVEATVTTWMGDKLGSATLGRPFRDSFGGQRVPLRMTGTNGRQYFGMYYRSSGDYCRIRAYKGGAK